MATSNTTNTPKKAPAAAARDHEWTDRAAEAAHDTVDRVAQRASGAEESIRAAAERSALTYEEKREQLAAQVDESTIRARAFATKNPLTTAGIAFAAGMLLTSLFRRR